MSETETIIEVKNVSYRYDETKVLENITLSVPRGTFLTIVGPNGSGKSTLLKLITGLLKCREGEIRLFGKRVEEFKEWEKIGYVSQKANRSIHFPATAFEVVRSGLAKRTGLFRFYPKEAKDQVMEALRAVDMERYAGQNIGALSGGEQQRVFIARALVGKPELLVLDEPTTGVDVKIVDALMEVLKKLNRETRLTLLLVTHDIAPVLPVTSQIAYLNRTIHFLGNAGEFRRLKNEDFLRFYGLDAY